MSTPDSGQIYVIIMELFGLERKSLSIKHPNNGLEC